MRKRNSSKASVAASKPSRDHLADDSSVTSRFELFNFPNGDRYEGGYRINREQPYLVRQGRGIYYTDDFNSYEATWEQDKIASDLRIRFNNGMEYKGDLDKDGKFSGPGTYRFPDGSSIEAVWKQNKPHLNIRYKEPLGYTWQGELFEDGDTVQFMSGNHFWDDMCVSQCQKPEDQPEVPEKMSTNSENA